MALHNQGRIYCMDDVRSQLAIKISDWFRFGCEEIDLIVIEHYLTKIHTQRRKKRMNFCVQRYKQILVLSLFCSK